MLLPSTGRMEQRIFCGKGFLPFCWLCSVPVCMQLLFFCSLKFGVFFSFRKALSQRQEEKGEKKNTFTKRKNRRHWKPYLLPVATVSCRKPEFWQQLCFPDSIRGNKLFLFQKQPLFAGRKEVGSPENFTFLYRVLVKKKHISRQKEQQWLKQRCWTHIESHCFLPGTYIITAVQEEQVKLDSNGIWGCVIGIAAWTETYNGGAWCGQLYISFL